MITNLQGSLASDVRLVFRFAYIIMLVASADFNESDLLADIRRFGYIGLIGTQANKLATQISLLRNRKVAVAHATGWLQGVQLWAPLVRMRRIPHFRWWILMAFMALMAKVADLSNVAIEQVYSYGQCEFGLDTLGNQTGKGMVIYGVGEGLEPDIYPKTNTQTFILAGNAQIASLNNHCANGVFWKADYNTGYCASKEDFMGGWNCSSLGDLQYPSSSTSNRDIVTDLQKRKLLYNLAFSNFDNFANFADPTTDYDELVVWSASAENGTNFTILAAADRSADRDGNKIMHSMYCYLDASHWAYLNPPGWPDPKAALVNISETINTTQVLYAWAATLQTYMYDGKMSNMVNDPEFWLQWLLNNMIMVAGSNDQPTRPPPSYSTSQGCYRLLVSIPNGIIFLVLFTFFLCLVMTLFLIWQYLRLLRYSDRNRVKYAPVDLWSWMSQAVAERYMDDHGNYQPVETKQLNEYNIELTNHESLRIERRGALLTGHHGHVEMEETGKPAAYVAPPLEVREV